MNPTQLPTRDTILVPDPSRTDYQVFLSVKESGLFLFLHSAWTRLDSPHRMKVSIPLCAFKRYVEGMYICQNLG